MNRKAINNQPTDIYRYPNKDVFLSQCNINFITKAIYNLHKNNNGTQNYLQFKRILPAKMQKWSMDKDINNYTIQGPEPSIAMDFINREFIKDNYDLYENPDINFQKPDVNVYKSTVKIGEPIDPDVDVVSVYEVKMKDLMPEDIKRLDVWQETETNVDSNIYRYGNKIPIWQTSMNTRHYDVSNEGFRQSKNRSSLNNLVMGYDMSGLINRVNRKNDADANIGQKSIRKDYQYQDYYSNNYQHQNQPSDYYY